MLSRSTAYLPAIDGLRALAVTAVFAYHFNPALVPGGYLGVDLFFVISGYLITLGLIEEHAATGQIGLRHFWLRRAKRLIPAVGALVLAMLALTALTDPVRLSTLRSEALATFVYVTNWYFVFREQPYFETIGQPSVLRHLWSLAVEEQFYLIWPIVLMLLLPRLRHSFVFMLILATAIASALLAYFLDIGGASLDRLYYATDTRASALLVGAALAFICKPVLGRRIGYTEEATIGALGIVGLVVAVDLFLFLDGSSTLLFRGGLELMTLTSAALIALCVRMEMPVTQLLGSAPLRWLGLRSYSIYLWHWPVVLLLPGALGLRDGTWQVLAPQIALTLLAAELSYQFIETPFRTGAIWQWRTEVARWPGLSRAGALAGAVAAAGGLLLLGGATIAARAPEPPPYLAVSNRSGIFVSDIPPAPAIAGSPVTPAAPLAIAPLPIATATRVPEPTVDAPDAVPPAAILEPQLASSGIQSSSSIAPTAMHGFVVGDPAADRPAAEIVTAVGDSVMLGSAYALARVFGVVDLDAAAGRSVDSVIRVLRDRADAGTLNTNVVIQIGNNGIIRDEELHLLLDFLAPDHRVFLVNVRVPRPWEAPNNALLARVARRYPNTVLVDWPAASDGKTNLLYDDHIHLKPEGAAFYAGLIAAAAAAGRTPDS